METKRKASATVTKILDYDIELTQKMVESLLNYSQFKSIQLYSTYLDFSCNGVFWFPIWIAFILFDKETLYEMQINLLLGLVIDAIVIAFLKALIRRRRPTSDRTALLIGPDKFSFPSGHTSRAFLIVWFFTILWPLQKIFWPPVLVWASCVALSRLLDRRHYLLDISAGLLISICICSVIKILWISKNTASKFMQYVLPDYFYYNIDD